MEILNPAENFELSSETKKQVAHTPKEFKRIANISVHGLFSTHRFDRCLSAFAGVILIEAITLYLFYSAAGGSGTFYLAALFAAVDFVLAVLSHRKQDEIIILSNQIAIADDPVIVQALEKKLRRISFDKRVFTIPLIWAIAAIKTFGFYANYLAIDSISIFVAALYFLEALLHVKFTGYIWYTWIYKHKAKKEHDAFVDSDRHRFAYDQNKPRHHLIESNIPLNNTRQGRQSLEREPETNRYHLNVFGILTDAELLNLVNDQDTNEQMRVVLKEGIKFQLDIMNLDPLSK